MTAPVIHNTNSATLTVNSVSLGDILELSVDGYEQEVADISIISTAVRVYRGTVVEPGSVKCKVYYDNAAHEATIALIAINQAPSAFSISYDSPAETITGNCLVKSVALSDVTLTGHATMDIEFKLSGPVVFGHSS